MSDPTDRELLTAAGRGDQRAFDTLVCRHTGRMYRVAVRVVADPLDAEDVVQNAWISAWRKLRTYRGEAEPATWLYRIVSNAALAHLRRQRPTVPIDESLQELPVPDVTAYDPETAVVQAERAASVHAAVAALEPAQRLPLVLHEFERLSYAEVAEVLDISVPAVASRLHRARVNLLSSLAGVR